MTSGAPQGSGLNATKAITPAQFALFRVALGVYLLQHFVHLIPSAAEVFSNAGTLPDPSLNPTHGLLPNPLATTWGGTPAFVTSFVTALALLSVLFLVGIRRRLVAVLLWFGWACLFNRNNLISNPSLPYIGFILLCCALIPEAEPWRVGSRVATKPRDWFFPAWVFRGAWWLMAGGYTFSGLVKLGSPSWVDGTAFRHLIDNPLARPGFFRDLFLSFPPSVIAFHTWAVLAAEILFLPMCLFKWGRVLAWTGMLVMHVGIILMVDFADLSFGMVMLHLFTFDPEWFPARRDARQPVLLYDGECGLCNAVVRFLIAEDSTARLRFAPLQSEPAQAYLRAQGLPTEDFDSIVFVPDWHVARPVKGGTSEVPAVTGRATAEAKVPAVTGRATAGGYLLRTDGVLQATDEIGGIWRVVSLLKWIPRRLRDAAYKLVARSRYALFGEYQPTPLPEPTWEARFLG